MSFLDRRDKRWLFSYSPHFTIGHMLIPANIKDPPKMPFVQLSASILLAAAFDRARHSDPYSIIGMTQVLYSFALVLGSVYYCS